VFLDPRGQLAFRETRFRAAAGIPAITVNAIGSPALLSYNPDLQVLVEPLGRLALVQ
jgi:hypothetical protein